MVQTGQDSGLVGYGGGDRNVARAQPCGQDWLRIASSSALLFPLARGATATAALDSACKAEEWTELHGVLIESLPASQRTLLIRDELDSVTLFQMLVPAAIAGQLFVPTFVPFGPRGVLIGGPWAVKLGGSDYTAQIHFTPASQKPIAVPYVDRRDGTNPILWPTPISQ